MAVASESAPTRGERTRGRLLEAGTAVFAERGFHAARVDDVVKTACTSHGTFYLYFSSKEDVFDALVRAIPQANVETVRTLTADPTVAADELLRRVLLLVGTFLRDERMIKFPRLIVGEAGNFPKLAETYKREVISRGLAILSSVIERGIAEGKFRRVDPKHAAYAALAPLLFTALFSNYWLWSRGHVNVNQPTASLAVLIYNFAGMPFQNQVELAWAAALVLVLLVLGANLIGQSLSANRVHQL